jgi:hypothetical protein
MTIFAERLLSGLDNHQDWLVMSLKDDWKTICLGGKTFRNAAANRDVHDKIKHRTPTPHPLPNNRLMPLRWLLGAWPALPMVFPSHAHASMFQGEALDTVADVMSWVVLVVAPLICITVFWLVHILPEKIAIQKQHPQAKAIQVLCLLSLFFGGLLWPLAWLWAYSKPVLHKLAYGTDKVPHGPDHSQALPDNDETEELRQLRRRVSELESKGVGIPPAAGEED